MTNYCTDKTFNNKLKINSNATRPSDFENCVDLKELKNSKKIPKKALKIKEKEADLLSIITEIQEYTKLKQNFGEIGIYNNEILKKNFPIVILNPGFEDSLCPTEKIGIGSII